MNKNQNMNIKINIYLYLNSSKKIGFHKRLIISDKKFSYKEYRVNIKLFIYKYYCCT